MFDEEMDKHFDKMIHALREDPDGDLDKDDEDGRLARAAKNVMVPYLECFREEFRRGDLDKAIDMSVAAIAEITRFAICTAVYKPDERRKLVDQIRDATLANIEELEKSEAEEAKARPATRVRCLDGRVVQFPEHESDPEGKWENVLEWLCQTVGDTDGRTTFHMDKDDPHLIIAERPGEMVA